MWVIGLLALFAFGALPGALGATLTFTLAASQSQPYQWTFSGGASGSNPTINAAVGDTLIFNVDTGGTFHPFSVHTTSSAGTSNNRYSGFSGGVYLSPPSTNGATLTIGADSPAILYYVCEVHPSMVGRINVAGGGTTPPPPPPPTIIPPPQLDICAKYAAAAFSGDEVALMTAVVTAVVGAELGNATILPFFNGQLPVGSTDFTNPANKARYDALAGGLIAYFGYYLGCRSPDFPVYTGSLDMFAIHKNMPIDQDTFQIFVTLFENTVASLGVTETAELDNFLQFFSLSIVNPTLICPKYATALQVSQVDLMTTIVGAVVGAELADPNIKIFFDGTAPAGSTNFTDPANTAKYNALATSLVAFFGAALGCNEAGFPQYNGGTMAAVHKNMPIGRDEFDAFNDHFITTLAGLGVTPGDQKTIRDILETFDKDIVHPELICPKYATALSVSQLDLMNTIVGAVVGAELADSDLVKFFNGVLPPGSTDFTTNTPAYNTLAGHLVSFFGSALGCNEPGFPTYTGNPNMVAVHANMPISLERFNKFNDIFITVLDTAGVSVPDQVTVRQILDSFQDQIVNPTYICEKYASALGKTQLELMQIIVGQVVTDELKDPEIVLRFDGSVPPGSIDFTKNATAFNNLAGNLVSFFGAAIGCTDPAFPAYTGNPNMVEVHKQMNISKEQFDTFNSIFMQSLFSLGVDLFDREAEVLPVLESFASSIVIPLPPPGTTGDEDLVALGYWYNQYVDCDIAIYWKYLDDPPTEVSFALRKVTDGMIGIAWPADSGYYMVGSDGVVGWQNGSAYAYYLEGKAKDTTGIVANTLFNITGESVSYINGVTTVFFTRLLNAGYNPIVDPSNVVVLVSSHESENYLTYHDCNSKTTYVLNLFDGTGFAGGFNQPQRNTHGVLMLVGWGLFIPLGMIVARYGRKVLDDGLWFKLHQALMISGFLLTTSAFVICWIMVEGVYFNTSFHSQLGLAIMILGYLQIFGGIIRPHKEEGEDPTTLRKVFEIVHPWTGRLLIALGCINIFSGISTWWPWFANVIYATCCVFPLAFITLGLEIMKQTGGDDKN